MLKIKNKKGEEGFNLTVGTVAKLVVAVACLLILIYLGVILANFYFKNTEINKANSELDEIILNLKQVEQTKLSREYFVTYAPEWFLFSSEFLELCEGPFCLCICKEKDCKKIETRACKPTDKFVVIRENLMETRIIPLKTLTKITMKFSEEKAYPFNAGANTKGWLIVNAITPLFFKFNNEWLWSPDLRNWMPTTTLIVYDGIWRNRSPTEENQLFINLLQQNKDSKTEGERIFYQTKAHFSEGFYIIEK